jgi:molybdate transport system permease protein
VQAIVALPLVLPPTVLGFYLLVALGPLTPFGRALIHLIGHPLAFSFTGLLVGSLLYSLPFAVQPLVAGFTAIDPGYLEASVGLGVRPSRTFTQIVLPMSRGSLLTSAVLTFTHTVGEFGVVLMLGGNIPGATRTLSISLYDQVEDFNYTAANHTALLLLVFATVALLGIYLIPSLRKLNGGQADVLR